MKKSSQKKQLITDPRQTALFVLNQLDKGNRTLDHVLETALKNYCRLSDRDTGLFHALVYGVLRWRGRLDWYIDYFSRTRLNKIRPEVMNILRLGLYQMYYLDRIPVSAAVNTSVELAKSSSPQWVVRFVNGLLRNTARRYSEVCFPPLDKDPVLFLSAEKSFPPWMIRRWITRFGPDETAKLCDAANLIPPVTIRANTLKISREQLIRELEIHTAETDTCNYSPEGIHCLGLNAAVPKLKGFDEGWFQVQDEAAQLVTRFLNPKPGERVLDACAGRGGKTGHMAQMMENRGLILALDHGRDKLSLLEAEMLRLGISIVSTKLWNLFTKPEIQKFGIFDRVLLDAPCSGLGVIRRNPDTKWSASKRDLNRYCKRQIRFLDNLAHLIKPGGIIVYAVCTTEPEENEQVVKSFLNHHPEFKVDKYSHESIKNIRQILTPEGYIRTYPHLNNTDGFFSVRFRQYA